MSHLVFDGDELNLSFYDKSGALIGSWQASNFGGPNSDFRTTKKEAYITWIPDGEYEFEKSSQRVPQKHGNPRVDAADGTYGSLGILKLAPIKYGGQIHTGVGIHAGRQHSKDSRILSSKPLVQGHFQAQYYRTNGCIRTTEAAMHAIAAVISKDPLKKLTVRNNGRNPLGKTEGSVPERLSP
jgi:hypothetical protein